MKEENAGVAEHLNDAAASEYFHVRNPYSNTDKVKIFGSYLCSEKPDLSQMDGEELELHRKRHFAKKGVDLVNGRKVDPRYDADAQTVGERVLAAREVVKAIMSDEHVSELADHIYENVKDREDKTVYLLRNSVMRDGQVSYNFLSPTYDLMLMQAMQEKIDGKDPDSGISFEMETAFRMNDTKRVYSNPMQRLARQAYIDTDDLQKMRGKNIVVADEHVQSGAMVTTIYSLLKNLGEETNVMGVTTLTSHPTMSDLHPSEDVNQLLQKHLSADEHEQLESSLSRVGLSYDTLTAREGLYVLALVMDGSQLDHRQEFEELERKMSGGRTVVEGVEDDLAAALMSPPLDVNEFDDGITEILQERSSTFYKVEAENNLDEILVEEEGLTHV